MGKSTVSCLKIISCGSDSVDHDDLQADESKGSSDRRGWSFRKRSARHRILSNSVTLEAPASASKENQESAAVNFQVQPDLTVSEKTSVVQITEEKTELSTDLDSKLSDTQASSVVQCMEEKTELSTHLDSKLLDTQACSEVLCTEEKTELSTQLDSKLSDTQACSEVLCTEEKTELSTHLDSKLLDTQACRVVQRTEEKTEFSTHLNSKSSDTQACREDDFRADATLDEPSVITIQAAIRGLLAQRVLLKQKNIIKLQAVVRGHLVRRHAVGTLRCVQAIIKMQALIRARRARLLVEGSADSAKQRKSNGQVKKEAQSSGRYTYVSIEKLLSSAFARQIMEATPRTIPINIKCDPLKSDAAWKWLERWMSVSSVSNEETQESGAATEQHNENLGHSDRKEEDMLVQTISKSTDSKSGVETSAEASNDDNLFGYDTNDLNLHSSKSMSPSSSHSNLHNNDQTNTRSDVTETAPTEMKEKDLVEVAEVKYLPEKDETGNDRNVPALEMVSAEQPETEVKKISRKASNPAFIAAQSKFEELSSATTSAKLTTSSSHDPGVESSLDKVSCSTDQPLRSKDTGLADDAISIPSAVQRGGSDCGTELSISSTLDSPDRSEAGVNDSAMEIKASDQTDHPRSGDNLELEAKSSVLETDPSCNSTNKLGRYESVNSVTSESLNSAIPADSPHLEKKPEADPSHRQLELGSEASHLVNKSSPEASPRSHVTVPESQATPSNQVSVKPKKSKGEKSDSNRKSRPSSTDKNLSKHNQDSASRSSLEQLQEHKTGKRRNSFGSAKPDHREQEPRDSSSSNSLPSYMQATESARAKAIANGSPRSSPDVHDKDIYIKKRHSLPAINERQGSPRIHRSLSQAQQNAKGSATNSPQDRKWRR